MHENRRNSNGVSLGPKHASEMVMTYDAKTARSADRARFLSHVEKTDSCWLWTGLQNHQGYGRFFLMELHSRNARAAHRAAFHLFVRPLSPDEWVLHSCDNKQCVNPDHLRAGDRLDNSRDATERKRLWQHKVTACPKGHPYTPDNIYPHGGKRQCRECRLEYQRERRRSRIARQWPNGVARGKAVLTLDQAEFIIANYRHTRRELAESLGVSLAVVDGVLKNRTWKELPRQIAPKSSDAPTDVQGNPIDGP